MKSIGTVKKIIEDRRYLFIVGGQDRESYFGHHTDCVDFGSLVEGARVEFVAGVGDKGPRATQIVALDKGGDRSDSPVTFGRAGVDTDDDDSGLRRFVSYGDPIRD